MKVLIVMVFACMAIAFAEPSLRRGTARPPYINRPTMPPQRFRRSADPEPQNRGSIYIEGRKPMSGPERRPSFDVGYQHKIYENKHGSISLDGGANKVPGQRWDPHVGLTGTFRFRRSAGENPGIEESFEE